MYRITYEQGNGYRCGCCRRTWTNTHDVKTEEEVLNWLEELKACQKISQWEDDGDREVISIEKEIGVDIQNQFVPRQENVDAIIAERQKVNDEKELEEQKERVDAEYNLYLELQEKFKK
jgi:hypothetical protein